MNEPHTADDWIGWVAARFEAAPLCYGHGTDNPGDEAAWLVGHCLKIDPRDLDAHLADRLDAAQVACVRALTEQRVATRKPLAYLIHEAWFAGLRFYVDERVIVPRSLTAEFILERFAPWVEPQQVGHILDLCTGSGCMAIACAHSFPHAQVDAVDISPEALAVAQINVKQHGLGERVRLVHSDLFTSLGGRRYDVIVSNPPYVDAADLAQMPEEYRHEPALALAAGGDGLAVVARILREAATHLSAHGILVVEVGNSRAAVERAWRRVPFLWLATSSGDESVFLLTAEDLRRHAAALTPD